MKDETAENRYRVGAIYRACMLLKEIAASDDPINVTLAQEILECSVDISFRTLQTLKECGFVRAVEGGFVIGEAPALLWKSYRLNQRQTIERGRQALADTAITGEKE